MKSLSPAVTRARARVGGLARAEGDMHAFAAGGRAAYRDKLLERFRGELLAEATERCETISEAELERRAELRRRQHYARLALLAAKARDRKRTFRLKTKTPAGQTAAGAEEEANGAAPTAAAPLEP